MDERWFKGISIIGGSLVAVIAISIILHFFDVKDRGLWLTFVAMSSGAFSIEIYLALKRRFSRSPDKGA